MFKTIKENPECHYYRSDYSMCVSVRVRVRVCVCVCSRVYVFS